MDLSMIYLNSVIIRCTSFSDTLLKSQNAFENKIIFKYEIDLTVSSVKLFSYGISRK